MMENVVTQEKLPLLFILEIFYDYEIFMNFLWKFFMTDAFLRKFSSFLSSSSTKHMWRDTLGS